MSIIKFEGFDKAILGLSLSSHDQEPIIVYDFNKCIDITCEAEGISDEEAYEHVLLNMVDLDEKSGKPLFICAYNEEFDLVFEEETKKVNIKPNLTLVK